MKHLMTFNEDINGDFIRKNLDWKSIHFMSDKFSRFEDKGYSFSVDVAYYKNSIDSYQDIAKNVYSTSGRQLFFEPLSPVERQKAFDYNIFYIVTVVGTDDIDDVGLIEDDIIGVLSGKFKNEKVSHYTRAMRMSFSKK